jgi:hypothetical protein
MILSPRFDSSPDISDTVLYVKRDQTSITASVFDRTAEESFRSSDFSFSDDACGEMPPPASHQQLSVGFIPVRLSALPNSELRS